MDMGAGTNQNHISSRLTALQSRKSLLEQEIFTKNELLRNLCIQEAELTGTLPLELSFISSDFNNSISNAKHSKKTMGISYQYPGHLLTKLNGQVQDESFTQLEVEIQVQNGIAEAAYSLSRDENLSKGVRRENMLIYERCQQKLTDLYQNLNMLLMSKNYDSLNSSNSISSLIDDELVSKLRNVNSKIGLLNISNYLENKKNDKISTENTMQQFNNRNLNSFISQKFTLPTYIQMQSSKTIQLKNYSLNSETITNDNTNNKLINSLKLQSPSTTSSPLMLQKNGLNKGFWKKNDFGDPIWCPTTMNFNKCSIARNSSPQSLKKLSMIDPKIATILNHDNRFGSLDRRKQKRIHYCNYDNGKSIPGSNINRRDFLSSMITNENITKMCNIKQSKQLIRTQSLGNIGSQFTDDNVQEDTSKIHKDKEWYETSLDSPKNDNCSSEKKAIENHKLLSSPQRHSDLSVEMPINCTVIEAGKWLPYRESTKPFEMSDFYKYSTKFRTKQSSSNLQTNL